MDKPVGSTPEVEAIINLLKTENEKNGFIEKLPGNAGLPVWDKFIKDKPKHNPNEAARGVIADAHGNYLIPLTNDKVTLSAVLFALYQDGKYNFYCYTNDYAYKICKGTYYSVAQREKVLALFMYMSNYVFGISEFKNIPKELFENAKSVSEGQCCKTISIQPVSEPPVDTAYVESLKCIMICIEIWEYDNCTCIPEEKRNPRDCDWCNECAPMDCFDEWVPNEGGGTVDQPDPPLPPGEPIGGGNSPSSPPSPPCPGSAWYVKAPLLGSQGQNCDPNTDPKDENGFYYSRITELNNILLQDPFALEPCDSLNIMPFGEFGNMWSEIASFEMPQNLKDRIDSVNNLFQPNNQLLPMAQQSLSAASGAMVNCDFFPVKITSLPNGYTSESLLEYFRLHINDFAQPSNTFEPYSFGYLLSNSFNDSLRFKASGQNSIGALIHIGIFGNSGTVMETSYTNYYNPITQHRTSKFIFSTLQSPLDNFHPVGGNRGFGIYNSSISPNTFTFYTMGVDRTWDWMDGLINSNLFGNIVFSGADNLWTTMQGNMIQFINSLPGGRAEYYLRKNIVARPMWEYVAKFLKKEISFEQLKTALGC